MWKWEESKGFDVATPSHHTFKNAVDLKLMKEMHYIMYACSYSILTTLPAVVVHQPFLTYQHVALNSVKKVSISTIFFNNDVMHVIVQAGRAETVFLSW